MSFEDDDLNSFFAEIKDIEVPNDEPSLALDVNIPEVKEVVVAMSKPVRPVIEYSVPEPSPPVMEAPQFRSNVQSYDSETRTSFQYQQQPPPPPQAPICVNAKLQNKKFVRCGGKEVWVDETLNEWPENDFRAFIGDIGKDVTTEMLAKMFSHYKSFAKAKVVVSKSENKGRGYGFVSFMDPMDLAKAIREMDGKYLGPR